MMRKTAPTQFIFLAGPTASGKTKLAVQLAQHLGGKVVNADSMQVYADLSILTARPTASEMGDVGHLLFGHVDASERYSAGRYARDVAQMLSDYSQGQQPLIFVGGTGLYFKALLEGLSPMPEVSDQALANWNAELERSGVNALHKRLSEVDPAAARAIERGDTQRIIRALSVYSSTGHPLSHWQAQSGTPLVSADRVLCLFLDRDREELRQRINRRVEVMIETGAIEEVQTLMERRLDETLPAMRAHGVKHLIAMLRGQIDLQDAIALTQSDSRKYAKRQRTWFRGQMSGWRLIDPDDKVCSILTGVSA